MNLIVLFTYIGAIAPLLIIFSLDPELQSTLSVSI